MLNQVRPASNSFSAASPGSPGGEALANGSSAQGNAAATAAPAAAAAATATGTSNWRFSSKYATRDLVWIVVFYCLGMLGAAATFAPLWFHCHVPVGEVRLPFQNSLVVGIAISAFRLVEFAIDYYKLDNILHHRMGYLIIITVALSCFSILYQFLDAPDFLHSARSIISAAQVIVLTASIMCSNKTLAFSNLTIVFTVLVILLFSGSEILMNFNINVESLNYFHVSLATVLLQAIYIICYSTDLFFKFSHIYRQFRSVQALFTHKLDCIVMGFIPLCFLVVKLGLCATYSFHRYDAGIRQYSLSNMLILLVYCLVFLSIPHISLSKGLNNAKIELNSKNTFVRYISHEIRTPLSTVNLGIELLIEELLAKVKQPHLLSQCSDIGVMGVVDVLRDIKLSCQIATNTLSDLLSYDKIQSNMLSIEKKLENVWNFVSSSVKPFHIQAKAAGIHLYCSNSDDINLDSIGAMIDSSKMEQVIRNLVSNALKFSHKNSEVNVKLTLHKHFSHHSTLTPGPKGVVRVSIIDQGAGISPENQKKLFRQYVQIRPNELQGGMGSGLGLWLSKAIVEQHGGQIGVRSDGEGKGSTFYFELPAHVMQFRTKSDALGTSVRLAAIPAMKREINAKNPMKIGMSLGSRIFELEEKSLSTSVSNYSANREQLARSIGSHNDLAAEIRSAECPGTAEDTKSSPSSSPNSPPIDPNNSFKVRSLEDRHLVKHCLSSFSFSEYTAIECRKKLNILITDDSALVRKMVERALIDVSDCCHHACDGQEAIDMVSQTPEFYDVILLDFYMPKVTGPVAAKAIKEMGYKGLIIGVTGSVNGDDSECFLSNGADGVISKPLSLSSFREALLCLKD